MRQFRMPIQHTKNLSKFKKQIGTILRDLNRFDDKEKYEAFSYLQGCISANKIKKRKKIRKLSTNDTPSVKKHVFKCKECDHVDKSKKGIFIHMEKHVGFPLSCKKCQRSFNNNISYEWHLKFLCHLKINRKLRKVACTECSRTFFSKQNLNRHLEGHKRNNCTYCDHVITNRKHLIQHLLEVHSIKLERAIYKCEECDKRYVKRRSLYYHKQQHYVNKFVCLECGKIFEKIEELNQHQEKHEQQKNFKCSKCGQKFSRRQQYLVHVKQHENYKCLTCNESFASKMRMMLHKQKGHNVEGLRPKFSCPDCEKEFFQKSKLILHLRKHSDDKPNLSCQYCDKTFQSPYAYYKHSTTVAHEKSSPETSIFICENCGSQFPKKYLLDQHYIRIHRNSKEIISCKFCSYKTKNKANMNRHMDTHIANGKTFICEQCGKDFHNMASLKGHISYIHTQKKQLKCKECDKTFKRNSELIRHQETHSDIRPHVCSICGQSYKRSTHLRRHKKSSHKIIPQKRPKKKLIMEPDGNFVLIEDEKLKKEQTNSSTTSSVKSQSQTTAPVVTIIESKPLSLVKREYETGVISDKILRIDQEQHHEITYFDNINTTANVSSDELNNIGEDIILDMSMISNGGDTQYFLGTQYTNDELIQEYINYENSQFIDVPSTSCYVLNNFFNQIDTDEFES